MDSGIVKTSEVDHLDEDKPIRNQNYACVSFISPEDVIVDKDAFYFNKFLSQFAKDMNTLMSGLLSKYPESEDLIKTIKSNHAYIFDHKEMDEQYKFFKNNNGQEIEKEYHAIQNFRTTIRGFKIRGTYDTIEEARNRCDILKKEDNKFNIYIAQVGCWCPWSPNPNDLSDQEWADSQLNTLMANYKKNMDSKDEIFNERKQEYVNSAKSTENYQIEGLEEKDPWLQKKEEAGTETDTEDAVE
jgi:hypothetical protein